MPYAAAIAAAAGQPPTASSTTGSTPWKLRERSRLGSLQSKLVFTDLDDLARRPQSGEAGDSRREASTKCSVLVHR